MIRQQFTLPNLMLVGGRGMARKTRRYPADSVQQSRGKRCIPVQQKGRMMMR
jgi:hypothetical protein